MYVRPFAEITKDDAVIAGGKGASLGEMTRAGIPVPPGFVVLADAFERFLEETDLGVEIDTILHTVKTDEMRSVEHASERIQKLILEAKTPEDISNEIFETFKELDAPFVAVRSSATAEDSASAAWAGQLDSFLNTTEATLLQNVQRCWASLFTPRAVFYRFEKELHTQKISVAVVVQKMVESEVSGIAFSVHPVTEDRNQLIIEAGYGLGEAIVSGQITPDSYVVEKEPRRIIDKNIVEQARGIYRKSDGGNEWKKILSEKRNLQKLSDEQILELSDLIVKIENHYGFPCDIEWAYEGACPPHSAEQCGRGKFYVVQSRPITTLSRSEVYKEENKKKTVRDFELTFEARGMSYLYESILFTNYHLVTGAVSLIREGVVQEFMHRDALAQMNKDGLALTPEAIRHLVQNMNDAFERCKEEWARAAQEPLSESMIRKVIADAGAVTNAYSFFDPHYFDALFVRSKHDVQAAEAIQFVQEYKNVAREYFNQVHFGEDGIIPQLVSRVSKETGIPIGELQYYNEEELVKVLRGERVSDALLADRHTCYVLQRSDDGENVMELTGKEALDFYEDFFAAREHFDGTILHGKIAHAPVSHVRGTVRCITRDYDNAERMFQEMDAMKDGEILVTQTTDPEMMPALRKASAAITDIGGMLSHTAIVARELGIPCIVDTKFATQILHDGDLVEVDADNGVVRIVERAEKEKQIFEKNYTRDTSLCIQGTWGTHCSNLMGTPEWQNPHRPVVIDYLNHGAVEIWENIAGMRWIKERLLEKNTNEPEFFREGMKTYEKQLKFLRPYWKKGSVSSAEELQEVLDVIVSATRGFVIMYLTACDERTPKHIKDVADTLRKEDVFFEENDKFMRKSFLTIRPDLEGLETAIFQHEVLDIPEASVLRGRMEHCLISGEELIGMENLESYATRNPEMEFCFDEIPREVIQVHGTVAHFGHVKGTVRIIRRKRDIHTVREGEILVAPMTTPDYLPAMKKSAAFVTDEGGIMCHAAIVAREMKKPCIIGTKIATQVLKDGDLVEVDADNGVVKIL